MPIGGTTRTGTGVFADPKMMNALTKAGFFPYHCTLQSAVESRDSAGSIVYLWNAVDGYTNINCRKFDRLPHEDRTLEIIEEIKFWTIALNGYYPWIGLAWRVVIVETGEVFHVEGVDSDSLHLFTVITCRAFVPTAEPGT